MCVARGDLGGLVKDVELVGDCQLGESPQISRCQRRLMSIVPTDDDRGVGDKCGVAVLAVAGSVECDERLSPRTGDGG